MKILFFISFLLLAVPCRAQETRVLPTPVLDSSTTLEQAVKNRQTVRAFADAPIDDRTLSNLLFVAWGITHDGKRTVPTAKNRQKMDVYVVTENGSWRYDASENKLIKTADLYDFLGAKGVMAHAPVHLLYVAQDDNDEYAAFHAGAMAQNVSLYATAAKLNQVVRGGGLNRDGIAAALGLEDDDQIIMAHAIGKAP